MDQKRIADPHKARALFVLCWAVYFCSYLARQNYSSVMSEMISLNVLSKSQAGGISTSYFIFYAGGQLINGLLGDRFSPKGMVLIGLLGSSISSFLFGLELPFEVLVILRAVTGYFSSMLWAPLLRYFAMMLERKRMIKASVHMNSAVALGTLSAYLMSAAVIYLWGWQVAFFLPAVLLCIMAGIWVVGYKKLWNFREEHGILSEEATKGFELGGRPSKLSFMALILIPGILLMIYPVIVNGVLKDGVTAWVPTYITEVFSKPAELAALVSTILPIANLSGGIAAQAVYFKLKNNEMRSAAVFFAISCVSLMLLYLLGHVNLLLSLLLFAIITSSMLAANTIFISIFPARFEPCGRSATMTGLLNSIAYTGSAAASSAIGYLSDFYGWGATVLSWLCITVLAFLICLLAGKVRTYPQNKLLEKISISGGNDLR